MSPDIGDVDCPQEWNKSFDCSWPSLSCVKFMHITKYFGDQNSETYSKGFEGGRDLASTYVLCHPLLSDP